MRGPLPLPGIPFTVPRLPVRWLTSRRRSAPPPAHDAAAQRTGTEEPLRSRERTAAVELEERAGQVAVPVAAVPVRLRLKDSPAGIGDDGGKG